MKKVIALMMIAVLVIVAAVGVSALDSSYMPTDAELEAAVHPTERFDFSQYPHRIYFSEPDSNEMTIIFFTGSMQFNNKYLEAGGGVQQWLVLRDDTIHYLGRQSTIQISYNGDGSDLPDRFTAGIISVSTDVLMSDGETVFFPRTLTPEERLALAKEKAMEEMTGHFGTTLSTLLPVGLAILASILILYLIGSRRWLMV